MKVDVNIAMEQVVELHIVNPVTKDTLAIVKSDDSSLLLKISSLYGTLGDHSVHPKHLRLPHNLDEFGVHPDHLESK